MLGKCNRIQREGNCDGMLWIECTYCGAIDNEPCRNKPRPTHEYLTEAEQIRLLNLKLSDLEAANAELLNLLSNKEHTVCMITPEHKPSPKKDDNDPYYSKKSMRYAAGMYISIGALIGVIIMQTVYLLSLSEYCK